MNKVQEKISYLPPTQQVALWVILRMPNAERENFKFFSSDFTTHFRRFASNKINGGSEEYGRFIGGVLSGLFRNGVLKRLSGGRSKLWTLSDEVKRSFEEYKRYLLEVKKYWT